MPDTDLERCLNTAVYRSPPVCVFGGHYLCHGLFICWQEVLYPVCFWKRECVYFEIKDPLRWGWRAGKSGRKGGEEEEEEKESNLAEEASKLYR